MAEQHLTIVVTTKSKRRAIEIVKFLTALVQLGETIEYAIVEKSTEKAKK